MTQYEHKMLPPRLEMEKLEDDILKQVGSERTVPLGARCPVKQQRAVQQAAGDQPYRSREGHVAGSSFHTVGCADA